MLANVQVRRRRYPSLTSLIDIIFLLLLFFMLSSTFSKYNEVEVAAALSGAGSSTERPELFISLSDESWKVNGETATTDTVTQLLTQYGSDEPVKAIMRVTDTVSSQLLIDAIEILNKEKIGVTLVR
ncbi:MAG: biopolymer transporter ExbD [Pseudomonadota bacterium]